jgi:catechol 2,3-dioxygenase-like lactoylglutathione lyase family enzyme
MHLSHLGLSVRSERSSRRFYSAYFGFHPARRPEYEDGTVIIRNADGFDLTLYPVGHVEPSPAFLHAGFKAAQPAWKWIDADVGFDRCGYDTKTIIGYAPVEHLP